MFKRLSNWWQYHIVRGEKKVAERGRAYIVKDIKVEARKYTAATDSWETIRIDQVKWNWDS